MVACEVVDNTVNKLLEIGRSLVSLLLGISDDDDEVVEASGDVSSVRCSFFLFRRYPLRHCVHFGYSRQV